MTLSINSSLLPYVPTSLLTGSTTSESAVTQNTDPLLQTEQDNEELLNALDGTNNTSSSTDPLLQDLQGTTNPSSNTDPLLSTYDASGNLNTTTNPSLLDYLG